MNTVQAKWPIRPELFPVSGAWSDLEYFLSILNGMLMGGPLQGHPSALTSLLPIYTPGWRQPRSQGFSFGVMFQWRRPGNEVVVGTVRVKCLVQEHNTMSPARTRTRTARSGVERTNHEAIFKKLWLKYFELNDMETSFFSDRSECWSVMKACERGTFFQLKVHEKGTFSIKLVYPGERHVSDICHTWKLRKSWFRIILSYC